VRRNTVYNNRKWKDYLRGFIFALIISVIIGAGFGGLGLSEAASEPATKAASKEESTPASATPLLVDVGADKCVPCVMMAPILDELKKDYSQSVQIKFVDVWKNPGAEKPYKIRVIPTQIFYDPSGKEFFRHEGFYSKADILGKFRDFGFDLKKDSELAAPSSKKAAPTAKGAKR
jgi:thioredoxin 1